MDGGGPAAGLVGGSLGNDFSGASPQDEVTVLSLIANTDRYAGAVTRDGRWG